MAQAIRQIGLKLAVALLRALSPRSGPGWRRSRRGAALRGR